MKRTLQVSIALLGFLTVAAGLCLPAFAQVDNSGQSSTVPFKISPTVPGKCVQGEFYYNSTAFMTYECSPVTPNTWRLPSAAGGIALTGVPAAGYVPVAVSATTAMWQPGPSVAPQQLAKWRLALAKERTGLSDAKILFVGDSLTQGFGGTHTTLPALDSYPWQLAAIFPGNVSAAPGLAIGGNGYGSSMDSRWTMGADWGGTAVGFGAASGIVNSTHLTNLVFSPTVYSYDRFDVYYLVGSGFGTITITATGGTPVVVNTGTGGSATAFTTVSAASPSVSNTVTIAPTSGGSMYIVGVEPWLSGTAKRVRLGIAGVAGSTTTNWSGPGNYAGLQAIAAYAPDLTIIQLGTNNPSQSISQATTKTDMAAIIATAQATGDVILMSFPPVQSTPAGELPYYLTVQALAASSNVPLIDEWARFGGAYSATWHYSDGVHLNGPGYLDLAGFVASFFAQIQ